MNCFLFEDYYVVGQNVSFFNGDGNWCVLVSMCQEVVLFEYNVFIVGNIYCINN